MAEEDAKKLIAKAQVEAKAKAQQEFESEKKALAEELLEKDAKHRNGLLGNIYLKFKKEYILFLKMHLMMTPTKVQ